jgi:mevalonate kinase
MICRLYDLKLSTRGLMEYAYRGEQVTPSNCGRMDQACAFTDPVLLTFDGPLLHCERIELKCDLHFVIVDLQTPKDTSLILRSLQAAYLHDSHKEVRYVNCLRCMMMRRSFLYAKETPGERSLFCV